MGAVSTIRELLARQRDRTARAASAPTQHLGTVHSVEGHTAYVAVDGGDGTTPCEMLVSCAAGDRVTVEVHDHRARVTGNLSRPATDDSVASATGQHFFFDENGIHITEAEGDPTTEHNILINSLGFLIRHALNQLLSVTQSAVAFYDGLGNTVEHIVAQFGRNGSQIGKDNEAHARLTSDALMMHDAGGSTYFKAITKEVVTPTTSDFTWTGDGQTLDFDIPSTSQPIGTTFPSCVVTVDGERVYDVYPQYTVAWSSNAMAINVRGVYFVTAPASGSTIVMSVTMGLKRAVIAGATQHESSLGDLSMTEGYDSRATGDIAHAEGQSIASGFISHAEGKSTAAGYGAHSEGRGRANGDYSHAEGSGTADQGSFAHAEGDGTHAAAYASHTGGVGTIALGEAQTVIGKHNVEDYNNTYVFIIGNGTLATPSNAFAIQWDGTMETAKPVPVASGGTGVSDFGTVVKKDVSSAVSVASSTNKSIADVSLTKGRWLLLYTAKFDTNATGRRQACLGTSSDSITPTWQRYCGSEVMAVTGGATILGSSYVRDVSSSETIYLTVFQSSGGNLDVTGNLQAIKLG